MSRSVPLFAAALLAAGLSASPAPAQEEGDAFGSSPTPAVADPWSAPHDPLNVSGEQLEWAGGRKPAAAEGPGSEPLEVWGELDLEPAGLGDWEEPGEVLPNPYGEPAPPSGDPAGAFAPAAAGTNAAGTNEVPGAASVEPVLRCVYRPHPTRTLDLYEFFRRHAAAGVDVSLRWVSAESGEPLAAQPSQLRYVSVEEQIAPGRTLRHFKPVAPKGSDAGDIRAELVIVAPAEAQRAIGLFFQLAVLDTAAVLPADSAPERTQTDPGFGSRVLGTPPLSTYPDSSGAARPNPAEPDFEVPSVADFGDDAFGPPADPSEGVGNDFDDSFGSDPTDRTTRRPVPRDE